MNKLSVTQFQAMIAEALKTINERAEEFSKLDAATGDGDHGEAMSTAFGVIAKASQKGGDFKSMLNEMGFGVMLETSGSTSTLLGGLMLGMSDNVPAISELDGAQVKAMFKGGLEGVQKNTKAVVGDKTMMDALIPAVEAMDKCPSEDIKELLSEAAKAAVIGADATVSMKANFGRARNLGEKSIGTMDSGAASWSSMFVSFAKAL